MTLMNYMWITSYRFCASIFHWRLNELSNSSQPLLIVKHSFVLQALYREVLIFLFLSCAAIESVTIWYILNLLCHCSLSLVLMRYTGGMAGHSCCRLSREFVHHWSLQWPSTTACSCDEETSWIKVIFEVLSLEIWFISLYALHMNV